jgi:hypothetical protein
MNLIPKTWRHLSVVLFVGVALGCFIVSCSCVGRYADKLVAITLRGVLFKPLVLPHDIRRLRWHLDGKFEVSRGGALLLLSKGQIYNVLSEAPLLRKRQGKLCDFCAFGDGIVAVSDNSLCSIGEGELKPEVQLPESGMSIASCSTGDRVFLFKGGQIYVFRAGGSYVKLLHADKPVLAVTGDGERIYFSIWDKILTWTSGEKEPTIILDSKLNKAIISLALDPHSGILYFGTGEGIWALAEGEAIMLLSGVTGDLVFDRTLLFVKDRSQRSILAVQGASPAVKRQWREMRADADSSL